MEQALLRVEIPCDLTAPAVVREALARAEGIEAMLDDATLVASELVTNAVVHSGCGTSDVIEVCVSRETGRILISVTDPGRSGKRAELAPGDRSGYGGFGLRVVEAVAARWGAERRDGYRVWAELSAGDGGRSLAPS